MPLPKPTPSELKDNDGQKKFISKCMGSPIMNKEFPKQEQRAGVCYSILRQAKKKKHSKGELEEPTWEEWDDNPDIVILP